MTMDQNYYSRTKDWIDETITNKNMIDFVYKEFYSNEIVRFSMPKGDPPQWVDWVIPPPFDTDHRFNNSYVAMVEYGSVWMNNLVEGMVFVMTPTFKLLRDMVFHLYWNYYNQHNIPPISYYPGTVAVLAWAGHSNYWHWFHDTLGRYHLLQLSGIPIDKYVLPKLTTPFHSETVEKLGIPKNKIIELTPDMHLRAKRLVLPSIPFKLGTCVNWTINFLREAFLNKSSRNKIPGFERIYISREDASWRKVINEDEVMSVLSKRGFKKIVLGSLTVQEQIDIFSSAEVITGANGAGLTNILFCEPGTKIIQLFTSTSDEFLKISNYLGLDYYFLKCAIASPPSTVHEVMNNLIVDIEKLSKILEMAGV